MNKILRKHIQKPVQCAIAPNNQLYSIGYGILKI